MIQTTRVAVSFADMQSIMHKLADVAEITDRKTFVAATLLSIVVLMGNPDSTTEERMEDLKAINHLVVDYFLLKEGVGISGPPN